MTIDVSYLCLQATRQGQASYAHVHEIIAGLKQRDFSVTLFEPEYAEETARLPGAMGRLSEFRRVQRRLMTATPDVLYIRSHFAARPSARWARRAGIPVVQEVNGPYEDLFLAWPSTRRFRRQLTDAMREQYETADALITVTDELARWLRQETGRQDVEVIPNAANTDLFRPGLPRPDDLPERYAVFFGALAPWQGIATLIDAVREPDWPTDLSLVIAGDGVERTHVEEAAAADSLIDYVGRVPYRELPGVVANAVVGLVPPDGIRATTGLSPLKCYETLACGVPVVVTDFPGQAELVRDNEVGLVVTAKDPRTLAGAVRAITANERAGAEMGQRGRRLIVEAHSWDARAGQAAGLLRRLLGTNPS